MQLPWQRNSHDGDGIWSDDQPIRAELFGVERFCAHATSLAQSQEISHDYVPVRTVVTRLHNNARVLLKSYTELAEAAADGKPVTPAAEWLIDNYYLIESHIRQAIEDLPASYYRQLPKIASGPLAGHPQIFGIAWAFIAHTDSRFDSAMFIAFINAYQDVRPLTIGELWAAAISLRLVLIENLRRISARTAALRRMRQLADERAEMLLDGRIDVDRLLDVFSNGTSAPERLSFTVQLMKRIRDQDQADSNLVERLRTEVGRLGHDFDSAIADEHHRQAMATVTMQNLITSLRFISDYHWEDWFDRVSKVDSLLRSSDQYGDMDFQTRNAYRSGIEDLSAHSPLSEIEVTEQVLSSARDVPADTPASSSSAGYYIVGPGRDAFERQISYRRPPKKRLAAALRGSGLAGYLGLAILLTAFVVWIGLVPLLSAPMATPVFVVFVALGVALSFESSLAMVNFAVTQLLRPVVLPGLEIMDGPTAELRTLVVIPSLLTSHSAIEELTERLEIHFLSNPRGVCQFALVTDWTDAPAEHAADDMELLNAALSGIAALNRRHGGDRFLLLHRFRQWNAAQERWMGWERKRGKLHELNRLLRGWADTSFMVIGGKLAMDVRYVITLDADTRLPRDSVRRLVGKISHPLNQAHFDADTGRVTSGYGILQPRVTASLPVGHGGSPYQRLYSSHRGIDPYVFAVSDVYQDLFGEGSFTGKGIYDVDVFEAALAGCVPENTMLSHDLFEGNLARAALVSDVEVVEDFPERYSVSVARQHRWIRGDWQLLPWLFGRAPRSSQRPPDISAVGQWKMLDNLRRSVQPIVVMLALLAGWTWLPNHRSAAWISFVILTAYIPVFLPLFGGSSLRIGTVTLTSQLRRIANDTLQSVLVTASNIVLLAHQAWMHADAIARTVYRLAYSRKHLLEWTTAAQVAANSRRGLGAEYALMWPSVLIGSAVFGLALLRGDGVLLSAMPFAIAWLLAPAVAHLMSEPATPKDELVAAPEDRALLRTTARRTWRYFEAFTGPDENHLPPDNFQEDPKPVIAHRTSPTNIGLYLLSVASAREFGWINAVTAVERIEATLATVHRLEKLNGHLLNWYDTQSLAPLEPRYVSSVDSGNLAGHLLAVANMCRQWCQHPAPAAERLEGLNDVLAILREELAGLLTGQREHVARHKQLRTMFDAFTAGVEAARAAPEMLAARLIALAMQASSIADLTTLAVRDAEPAAAENVRHWASALRQTVEQHFVEASIDTKVMADLTKRLTAAADDAHGIALAMQFGFLSDPRRNLMSIGYRVTEHALDESCYDMLASEAALASYLAIAKGDLPARHWFRLGRPVTAVNGRAALVSWSGSMFEYIMPAIVLDPPSASLIDQTIRLVVQQQIAYGKKLGVPWGISESAFSARDRNLTYQYSNFGVPGLGLKRGLAANVVVAPYATALASMFAPQEAAANLRILDGVGARGDYGFYESVDYTPARLPEGETHVVVKAYFAHHQGMTITAILNTVLGHRIRNNFHEENIVRAAELLLQERAPEEVPVPLAGIATAPPDMQSEAEAAAPRAVDPRRTGNPDVQLLSNGHLTTMITATGSGSLSWRGIAISRWREDPVCDPWGHFIFLREMRGGKRWSAGYSPRVREPEDYGAEFSEDKVALRRVDGPFTTTLQCVVSNESDAEVRRVNVVNNSSRSQIIEITSYMELALAPPAADAAHPAFSKLFVVTEFVPELGAVIAMRRRREVSDPQVWAAQFLVPYSDGASAIEFETSRAQFLGLGNTLSTAQAFRPGKTLDGATGAVLDPVFALRQRLRVAAGQQACWSVWTVVAESREGVLDLVDSHRQRAAYERASVLAWTHSRVQLRHFAVEGGEAEVFRRLANLIVYASAAARPSSTALQQQAREQTRLWASGVSGVRPILLIRIDAVEDLDIIRQLLRGHGYWSAKRFAVDLVILNERRASYMQDLQAAIEDLVRKSQTAMGTTEGSGQVFALRADLLPSETVALLPAVARVTLHARAGALSRQVSRMQLPARAPARMPAEDPAYLTPARVPPATPDLQFFNGWGGFSGDGREYVIPHDPAKPLPAPWINVIANGEFGTHAGANGGGYTWYANARERQITPWANDPVVNAPSEIFYVRDLRSGQLMSPCIAPVKQANATFRTRHGFGYTVHESQHGALAMELTHLVPVHGPVKISRLRLRSTSPSPQTLSVTFFAELVLGASRGATAFHIQTSLDAETGALMARNPWTPEFGDQIVFFDLAGKQTSMTGDRHAFLGAYGTSTAPAEVMSGADLSGAFGAGLDPCAALQQVVTVSAATPVEVIVLIGATSSVESARSLVQKYRGADVEALLRDVRAFWDDTLSAVQVETPDGAMNVMLNGWLMYQALACRMLGRSGTYQASGAYGFRDQLQDSMAVCLSRPEIARAHILRAGSRQFPEGDVQHWWLPETGAGTRTRISDDAAWLTYCTMHYVSVTNDAAILDEALPFLEGRVLEPAEHDAYFPPHVSDRTASLYEHCCIGLEHSLTRGPHGLPLIGGGDWNDGLNRVGEKGRGESTWLAWFLIATLKTILPESERRGDTARITRWKDAIKSLTTAVEKHGWDGAWYRRGYFDDGTPLGSKDSSECRIDVIAQSWSVLAGTAAPDRAASAIAEVRKQLIRPEDGLALLFTPPFDSSQPDPGYIRAYPPGLRENGGQYSHGAIWSVFALMQLGQVDEAVSLFNQLNPVNHARTSEDAARYKVEPYVMVADIYSVAPHVGRGGWTWYTGAAAWLYRAGIEAVLGLSWDGDAVRVSPRLPTGWDRTRVTVRRGKARLQITIVRGGVEPGAMDGLQKLNDAQWRISFPRDESVREIEFPSQ